jgi:hypothetical protein
MRGRPALATAAAALLAAVVVGCGDNARPPAGDDGGPPDTIAPPLGATIVGTVTDLADGAALRGARVWTVVPAPSGAAVVADATDDRGAYALTGLPAAGTYRLTFAAEGHVDRLVDVTVPGAGTALADTVITQDVALAAADAALAGAVTGYHGAPAAGAVLLVDLRGAGFDLVAQATAAADGTYVLPGLPGAPAGLRCTLAVLPYDADGDGIVDYGPGTLAATTYPATTTRLDVDLRPFAVPLALLDSDLEQGTHPAAPPLALRFNLPPDAATTTATLVDLDLGLAVGATVALQGVRLTVDTASGTPLAEGHEYELGVDARAGNGTALVVTRRFQVVSGPVTTLPPVAGLVVSPAAADCATVDFTLDFAAVPGAAGYQIFARDSAHNPSFLLVATAGSATAPHVPVTLPAAFDLYSADALQTPFADHTRVDFAVVPVDIYGHVGDPNTAAVVSRTDGVRPTVIGATPDGSADNLSGATAATVALDVDFSELLDPALSNVAIALPVVGMSAGFVLDAALLSGRFTITVPPLTDGRGAYSITGAVDTSGNVMLPHAGALP